MNVDSYSLGATNRPVSITVSAAANPGTYNAFLQNAVAAHRALLNGTAQPFPGTLSDVTLQSSVTYSFGGMLITNVVLPSLGSSTTSPVTLTLIYQSVTHTS
jgi:hypothetical protein